MWITPENETAATDTEHSGKCFQRHLSPHPLLIWNVLLQESHLTFSLANRNDHAYWSVCRRPNLPFIWISWRQDQPAFSCKENRCLNHVAPFGNELNGDQRPPHCLTIASWVTSQTKAGFHTGIIALLRRWRLQASSWSRQITWLTWQLWLGLQRNAQSSTLWDLFLWKKRYHWFIS